MVKLTSLSTISRRSDWGYRKDTWSKRISPRMGGILCAVFGVLAAVADIRLMVEHLHTRLPQARARVMPMRTMENIITLIRMLLM